MDEQTLSKPINLEGLGTALSALKRQLENYVNTAHEAELDTDVSAMLTRLGLNANVSLIGDSQVGTAQVA